MSITTSKGTALVAMLFVNTCDTAHRIPIRDGNLHATYQTKCGDLLVTGQALGGTTYSMKFTLASTSDILVHVKRFQVKLDGRDIERRIWVSDKKIQDDVIELTGNQSFSLGFTAFAGKEIIIASDSLLEHKEKVCQLDTIRVKHGQVE